VEVAKLVADATDGKDPNLVIAALLQRRQSNGCFAPQRLPGETCSAFTKERTQARRWPDRNASPDSGQEAQGNCRQGRNKADRAAEKDRIEA
jgi:hypothetical protein